MRILIVEDEKISRAYLMTISKPYGECDSAENGEIAVEKIERAFEENDRYDIIFLDIMLPKMTGHQVLQIIRAYEQDHRIEERTRIIMTSALRDNENVKKAYENLADGYIVKPIFKDKIAEIINEYKQIIKE